MAQIPAPEFSVTPTAAQLNAAIGPYVREIGGVDESGHPFPGNLDASNLRAAPGFRNGQKAEPYGQFAVAVSNLDAPAQVGPFPFDAVIFAVTFACLDAWDAKVTIGVAGRSLAALSGGRENGTFSWTVALLVPAGAIVSASAEVDVAPTEPWVATLHMKALHRR